MTDFSKMVNLARKGRRPVEVEETYPVTDPWMLGWVEIEEEEHGVRTTRSYNVVYSPFVPSGDKLPSLFMRYDTPFWELRGRYWRILKRRVVGFSESTEGITEIREEDLDDLHDRLTGEWLDDDM